VFAGPFCMRLHARKCCAGARTTDCLGGTARVAREENHPCTFAVACTGTDLMSRTTIPNPQLCQPYRPISSLRNAWHSILGSICKNSRACLRVRSTSCPTLVCSYYNGVL
jgi:hypothetical protein